MQLILYKDFIPTTLPSTNISCNRILVNSLGFSTYTTKLCANTVLLLHFQFLKLTFSFDL